MKIIPSSRKNRYIAGVIILLAAVALIVWLVSWLSAPSYDLTIASTAGGSVNTPGEAGPYTYDEGIVVNLVAEADAGYRFVNWTGNVSTITDVNAAATNITMNGAYSISANFAPEIPENLEIRTWHDLDAIRDNLAGNYTLMNDLDSTTPGYAELASPTANGGNGWQPIGNFTDSFTGTFDGQGYEIRDLFINRRDKYFVGLFSFVGEGGRIEDIGVVNAIVTGYDNVGGLAGWSYGTVGDSYSTGSVTGTESAHEPGDIGGVGGAVGINAGNVSHCYSTGSVTGYEVVGGLVGYSYGTVSDSYSTGSVTGYDTVGGLVGFNHYGGTVSNSHSTGTVTGDAVVGGLVGFNLAGTVSYSYSTSSVTGNSSGGLVGFNAGFVSDSYSTGSVTGYDTVGGLVGCNWKGTVGDSYSTGSVTGNSFVGGLVGYNLEGIVSNSFWDTETSGQSTSDGGTGKTTAQMQDITTFSGAAWDIIAVANPDERNPSYAWNIVYDQTYPFLSWQP
jgi:hypothetical protein